jgi:hypothetical protein
LQQAVLALLHLNTVDEKSGNGLGRRFPGA